MNGSIGSISWLLVNVLVAATTVAAAQDRPSLEDSPVDASADASPFSIQTGPFESHPTTLERPAFLDGEHHSGRPTGDEPQVGPTDMPRVTFQDNSQPPTSVPEAGTSRSGRSGIPLARQPAYTVFGIAGLVAGFILVIRWRRAPVRR